MHVCRLLEDNTILDCIVSTDENGVIVSADILWTVQASDDEKIVKERATLARIVILEGTANGRRSLEDFDRSFLGNAEMEDDYHGNLNYEARLVADEVRMCVCVCVCDE